MYKTSAVNVVEKRFCKNSAFWIFEPAIANLCWSWDVASSVLSGIIGKQRRRDIKRFSASDLQVIVFYLENFPLLKRVGVWSAGSTDKNTR